MWGAVLSLAFRCMRLSELYVWIWKKKRRSLLQIMCRWSCFSWGRHATRKSTTFTALFLHHLSSSEKNNCIFKKHWGHIRRLLFAVALHFHQCVAAVLHWNVISLTLQHSHKPHSGVFINVLYRIIGLVFFFAFEPLITTYTRPLFDAVL